MRSVKVRRSLHSLSTCAKFSVLFERVWQSIRPVLSVVIPTYNCRDSLDLTLAGFSTQTMSRDDFELIVVDDGSTDDTALCCERYRDAMPIRYVFQEHAGRSIARNAGVERAVGVHLVMCDADAIPCPEYLSAHREMLERRPDSLVLGEKIDILARWAPGMLDRYLRTFADIHGEDPRLSGAISSARAQKLVTFLRPSDVLASPKIIDEFVVDAEPVPDDALGAALEGSPIAWTQLCTRNVSMSRSLFDRLGGFDESFVGWGLEDAELGYRACLLGIRYVYAPEAKNYHQLHERLEDRRRWRTCAENYRRFLVKHPHLGPLLYWRLLTKLMSPVEYAALAARWEANVLHEDYRRVAYGLAMAYCDLDDPSPEAARQSWLGRLVKRFDDAPPWSDVFV